MSKNENKVKKPFFKKIWFWVVAIIAVAVGGNALSGGTQDDHARTDQPPTQQQTKPADSKPAEPAKPTETPAKVVTFEQMVKDYLANGVAADETYKGKKLEFTGTVKTITSGTFGGSDIEVAAGNFTDNQFQETTARINVSSEVAKKLTSGQAYTFVAKGDGAIVTDGWVMTLNFTGGIVK